MNYGQLKTKLRDFSHRADSVLESNMQGIIDTAKQRINVRFGFELPSMFIDTDTNTVLANHDDLYFYSSMRELSVFIKDFEEAVRIDELFDKECSRINIHYQGEDWVTGHYGVPFIHSEQEIAAEAEAASGN